MTQHWNHDHGNTRDAEYAAFLQALMQRFTALVPAGTVVFATDACDKAKGQPSRMWSEYLSSFPEDIRQEHNCNECHRFIDRFGHVVVIDANGTQTSPIWDVNIAPPKYKLAIARLAELAARGRVKGVFLSEETMWGQPTTGVWTHLAVKPHPLNVFRRTTLSAKQRMAELRQDFLTLRAGLQAYSPAIVARAVEVLSSNTMYRSEVVLPAAQWLAGFPRDASTNLQWLAVAGARPGYAKPKSGMLGTLLDGLVAGHDLGRIKREFESKMEAGSYRTSTAAPREGQIAAAERIFAEMGLAAALPRRYARFEDVQAGIVWAPNPGAAQPVAAMPRAAIPVGTFGHLSPAAAAPALPDMNIPPEVMSFAKFGRTLLTKALALDVLVPASIDRFAALTTAVDPNAPKLLAWDNPVDWYYGAGTDGEIRRRVLEAGGRMDDVDIRVSLIWNNRNDLDLHIVNPRGTHLYYGSKQDSCGGFLDVDMNVRGETTKPVENTRWPRGQAPEGGYQVMVRNYCSHENFSQSTNFEIEIEMHGKVARFQGVIGASRGYSTSQPTVPVATLTFARDAARSVIAPSSQVRTVGLTNVPAPAGGAAPAALNAWNVPTGAWVPVTGLVMSPNAWGRATGLGDMQGNDHLFFLLQNCRDTQDNVGRGFFSEHLRSELHPVRAVLEAQARSAPVADADQASACGIGMRVANAWDLTVRVNVGGAYKPVRIDRFE